MVHAAFAIYGKRLTRIHQNLVDITWISKEFGILSCLHMDC